jgi:acyl CoA:acetate/3-ketoacid CoA transferase beta subunit
MKISWNLLFQGAALIVQYGNQASGLIPSKYQPGVALAVGLAQGLVAWRAHYFNPDGTPASTAYAGKK